MKKRKKKLNKKPWIIALVVSLCVVLGSTVFLWRQTPEIKYELSSAYRWEEVGEGGRMGRVAGPEVECREGGGRYFRISRTEGQPASGVCHKTTLEENMAWVTIILGSLISIVLLVKLILLSIRRRSGAPMVHE